MHIRLNSYIKPTKKSLPIIFDTIVPLFLKSCISIKNITELYIHHYLDTNIQKNTPFCLQNDRLNNIINNI